MYKKILALLSLSLLSHIGFAETCPNVDDIKNHKLIGWNAFDSDDDTVLSSDRDASFRKDIKQFALAEWTNASTQSGTIRCFYRDKEGSTLDAYLSKTSFLPENSKNLWYQVSGSMQCAAGKELCQFQTNHLVKNQLAKK